MSDVCSNCGRDLRVRHICEVCHRELLCGSVSEPCTVGGCEERRFVDPEGLEARESDLSIWVRLEDGEKLTRPRGMIDPT